MAERFIFTPTPEQRDKVRRVKEARGLNYESEAIRHIIDAHGEGEPIKETDLHVTPLTPTSNMAVVKKPRRPKPTATAPKAAAPAGSRLKGEWKAP